jgi:hypothetical protein
MPLFSSFVCHCFLLNIFAQILIAGKIVSFRIAFIYLISEIFGFIFGPEVIAKLEFSGSIFSLIALSLLHLRVPPSF